MKYIDEFWLSETYSIFVVFFAAEELKKSLGHTLHGGYCVA